MPEESPAAPPPAPPAAAPGIAELFEQSLMALARAPSVFAAAALRPPPSFGAAAGLALAAGAAALVVNLTHGFVSNPDFLQRFPPLMIAVVAVAAFGLYSSLVLLLCVLLYGLGRSLGGTGDFDRALQAAAALSLVAPVQALCNWFPLVWALPALLAAWVAAGALEGLFKTPAFPARAACAGLAGAVIGLQFAGRIFVERAGQAYMLTRAESSALSANDDLARQIQTLQTQAAALGSTPAAAGTSGLDLLRGPEAETRDAPPAEASPAAMMKDASEVQQQASAMLGTLAPILDNPETTKNMSPQQKADMKDLQVLMKDLQAQMKPGAARLSETERAKQMSQVQQMTMRMMSAAMQVQPAPKNEVKK
ncbi:MAG: hypothetical protein A2506_01630 [Elusimicrobia bacterium RIFOXYD12_FULL_66_9]|nr:MAG: hypothetical protein A2506_01630 [Elusimicrobia bacterium RIFOXYD12_FULL_66_9]